MKMDNDGGTEYVLASVRDARYLRPVMVPLIFVATTLTHLCGGSAGREGAALQIGGGISSFLGRKLKLDSRDERIITMAGMAAGFSALFGTPLAAAVFAMEVESVGIMYYAAIVPCFFSALLADIVAGFCGCTGTSFVVSGAPDITLLTMVQIIILGGLCGMLSNLFCRAMRGVGYLFRRYLKKNWQKVLVGGVLIILLSLIFGRDYNGAGMNIIENAVNGTAVPWAFLLKILFTAITLRAGYKGGEIVPSFFIGATFGCVVAPLLGISAGFGAAVGMVAVFCGVTNSPMTSILLGYELFAGVGVAPMALAVAVSYMLSGYTGLYHEQKIIYSKTKALYIDKKGDEEYFNREKDLDNQ
jgi:H+/Cl- antiporter ClcA